MTADDDNETRAAAGLTGQDETGGGMSGDQAEDTIADEGGEAGQPKLPVIGDYALLGKIGAGGMGRVFKAQHRRMDRLVALKILSKKNMRDPQAVKRFHREMKAAAKLIHPNIVTAFDAGEQDGVLYLVMEFIDGPSLNQIVKNHGVFTVEKAIEATLAGAKGLAYSHSCGMVHRDIKPSNLIQDADGTVKILDMGTARLGGSGASEGDLTQQGTIMGTVNYMAPEQARDAAAADLRSDVYSLGCTLFYLLTGRSLYTGDVIEILIAHAQKPIPQLREFRDDVPHWLEELYVRMVAKKPAERYQSMEEIVRDIEIALNPEDLDSSGSTLITDLPTPQSVKAMPIAMDLGTSSCAIAWLDKKGQPVVIETTQGEASTPSFVWVDGMDTSIGQAAMKGISDHPDLPALEIKRFLGRAMYPEAMGGERYRPEVLQGLILAKLCFDFQRKVGSVKQAVITTPGCFDETRRKAIQDAGFMAGFEVAGLVSEPLSAAVYHAYDQPEQLTSDSRWLVIDLGGGTLDVAAVAAADESLEVVASGGDARLGGRDWDDCIIDLASEILRKEHGFDPVQDAKRALRFWQACEWTKKALSQRDEVTMKLQVPAGMTHVTITREQFESAAAPLVARVELAIEDAIKSAGWSWEDVDRVLLTGGGCRMPMISSTIQQLAGSKLALLQLPDDAVVKGAALQAGYRMQRAGDPQGGMVVKNTSFQSLGVAGFNGEEWVNIILIPRGTTLPVTAKRTFKTHAAGQKSIGVQLLEGENESPSDCIEIGNCAIDGLSPDLPENTPVQVDLQYDIDGRVSVFAQLPDQTKRTRQSITREHELSASDLHRLREWVETVMLCSSIT